MSTKVIGGGYGFKTKLVTIATTVAFSGVAAIMPIAVVADHSTAHTIEQLQASIAELTKKLAALQAPSGGGGGAKCSFTRSLTVGSRGDDVTCLQDYLTSTGHFTFSGGSTGYFGSVSKAAVAAWQAANGVSPAVGYFGPKSQVKYDAMVAAAPPPAPPAPPAPPPGTPPPPTPPPGVSSGLTVSAVAAQPPAVIVPESAARVPFTQIVFTASADGDATVKSITVQRKGIADDAAFDGVILIDEDNVQIGTSKTLSSDHKVVLSESFKVKAGTSKTVTVAANMATSLDDYSGQIGKLAVIAVDAGTTAVSGVLPIEGNGMTLNHTLAIGSVTMSIGSLDPGAANTKNVGTTGYYLASVKASVGSAENVTFKQLRWNQAGSAATGDLKNVMVKIGDKNYPIEVSSDGKYYIVKVTDGVKVNKGGTIEFSIKSDLVDGSARTVDFDILRKSDIVVQGDTYGHHILVGGGSSGSASAGAFSSNQEPFFNAYAATINKGSLLLSSSNKVTATNIAIEVSDVSLGGFLLDVKGEPMQISKFEIGFNFTGTGTATDITQVKLVTEAGSIVAGPKDPASGTVKWTDTWTAPVGETHYLVKGKLDTTFVSNDTIIVRVDPDDNLTVKGSVTGLSVTPTPSTVVTANTQTVKAGALAMSVSPTPFGQNVVRGLNGYHFATLVFDAGSSGEDTRVTTVKPTMTVSVDGAEADLNSCVIYDGTTALNTGSDVVNPSDDSGTDTAEEFTFTLTNNLIVPKGTAKKVDLKCNISANATNNRTYAWGLTIADSANVTGAQTSQSVTESVTTNNGSTMTIKTAGSYTVTKDITSPISNLVIGGKTDVPLAVWKFRATDEAVDINDITLTYSSSTASTSDFLKATLWDGATKIGEAVWAGATAQFATSTLTQDLIIPKDTDKLVTIKVDLASINTVASTTAGRLLAIHYDGNSSTSGTGQSSGLRLGSGSSASFSGEAQQIMKSMPKFDKISVPSTSVAQLDAVLYRFKVTGDAAGPIGLYKFSFNVSSSTVSATSSNFRLYAYSDSAFSVNRYAINPISVNNVDCVNHSSFDNDPTAGTCNNNNGGSGMASSGDVVFFSDVSTNVASTGDAIGVNAGETVYFQLVGDLTNPGSGTGNSIQVSLLGDAARPAQSNNTGATAFLTYGSGAISDGGRGRMGNAIEVAIQSANNDFVWSPLSTTTSLTNATSTQDWTNGFNVPGLPSVNMSANTFTN